LLVSRSKIQSFKLIFYWQIFHLRLSRATTITSPTIPTATTDPAAAVTPVDLVETQGLVGQEVLEARVQEAPIAPAQVLVPDRVALGVECGKDQDKWLLNTVSMISSEESQKCVLLEITWMKSANCWAKPSNQASTIPFNFESGRRNVGSI
jgi:hypothetical protein